MTVIIEPGRITGSVSAIPSKSHLHRLLICAALADKETLIASAATEAEDIQATIACLAALGASVEPRGQAFAVMPINREAVKTGSEALLPCGESGSTLRFLLPVICALGACGSFNMKGRLPQRPIEPLGSLLQSGGIRLRSGTDGFLSCEGQLAPGSYRLPGNISSQYISGMLFALPLLGAPSSLTVTQPIESADYIAMTLETLQAFGIRPSAASCPDAVRYDIAGIGAFSSPTNAAAEGDWSNGAFWLCAGAMPGGDVRLSGLNEKSSQGDRAIMDILAQVGANIGWEGGAVRASEGGRRGIEFDARAIPDLVPVLAAVLAAGTGTAVIRNAARLRLKESDRLSATAQTLTALGADVAETEDSLVINGRPCLQGGSVDAFGDHRIAMMAAIASAACSGTVTISGAQAVNKSYPGFWGDLAALGKTVRMEA